MATIFEAKQISPIKNDMNLATEVTRLVNGNVGIVICAWTENAYKTYKTYRLTADEAMRLGRALCAADPEMDEIVNRARSMQSTKEE